MQGMLHSVAHDAVSHLFCTAKHIFRRITILVTGNDAHVQLLLLFAIKTSDLLIA